VGKTHLAVALGLKAIEAGGDVPIAVERGRVAAPDS